MEEKNTPLLSVCLITYNHAAYIRQAIEGVLMQQTNFSWELIIADDCSTDGTREIVAEYAQRFPGKIITILQPHNVGPAKNWKDLLFRPQSLYIAYFEGDDYWTDPLKLQKQVDFLEQHPGCALCHHLHQTLKDGKLSPVAPAAAKRNRYEIYPVEKLADRNFIYSSTIVFRRKVLEYLPSWFFELSVGDYPLFLFAGKLGNYGLIKEYMSVYRTHEGGSWSSRDKVQKALTVVRLLAKLQEGFSDLPVVRARLMRSMLQQAEVVRQSGSAEADAYVAQCQPAFAEVFLPVMDELIALKTKSAATPTLKKIQSDTRRWLQWKLWS